MTNERREPTFGEGQGPGGLTRRDFLGGTMALGASGLVSAPVRAQAGEGKGRSVVVVGAGAFGGWTALALLRAGAKVTLVDAWGPGHSRASSGGENRVIRGMYGPDRVYTEWVVRSWELWAEAERLFGQRVYQPTGALWMFRGDDAYARAAEPVLKEVGLAAEPLTAEDAAGRFPAIDFTGIRHVWYEPRAGYLAARRACRLVAAAAGAAGADVRQAHALPGEIAEGRLDGIRLDDGSRLEADAYVFACGPWLGSLFPDVVGWRVRPTRQEVFFFGTPPGGEFDAATFPVWIDFGERIFYGLVDNEGRGFKIADDTHGPEIDPTDQEREPSPEPVRRARQLLAQRFPALRDAPLVESRVCQYESTPDGDLLLDRHPEAENVWLAGGGSGHGFKLGPAVGEHVAALALGRTEPLEKFSLARLGEPPSEGDATRSQLRCLEDC